MSYDEIVEYILPVLEIYSNEQEFLKLQFFQKLPYLFEKLILDSVNNINLNRYTIEKQARCNRFADNTSVSIDI